MRPRPQEYGYAETAYLIFASKQIRCGVFSLNPLVQTNTQLPFRDCAITIPGGEVGKFSGGGGGMGENDNKREGGVGCKT